MLGSVRQNYPLLVAILASVGLWSWAVLAQDAKQGEFTTVEDLIERFETDRRALERYYGWRVLSEEHFERLGRFYDEWLAALGAIDFDGLNQSGRIDHLLMRHRLDYLKKSLATDWRKFGEIDSLVGFGERVQTLYQAYRSHEKLVPREAAEELAGVKAAVGMGEVSVKLAREVFALWLVTQTPGSSRAGWDK